MLFDYILLYLEIKKQGENGELVIVAALKFTGGGYYPPKITYIIIFADNVRSPETFIIKSFIIVFVSPLFHLKISFGIINEN